MRIIIKLDTMLTRRKMKLIELNKMIGMDYNRLSAFKNGRVKSVKLSTLLAICLALECQPSDLLQLVYPGEPGPQE